MRMMPCFSTVQTLTSLTRRKPVLLCAFLVFSCAARAPARDLVLTVTGLKRPVQDHVVALDLDFETLSAFSALPRRVEPGTIGVWTADEKGQPAQRVPASLALADPEAPASYYGDNREGSMPIERACPRTAPDRQLIAWMSLFQ